MADRRRLFNGSCFADRIFCVVAKQHFSCYASFFIAMFMPIETIIQLVNFGALTSFMVLNLSVFAYFFVKKRKRDMKGFINYCLLPWLGFLVIGFVWWGFDWKTFAVGTSWMIVGVILLAFKTKGFRELPPTMRDL
ncbi:hypothetical protein ABHN11_06525 [Brevibacillus centrosporus]|uniref:hypothetical protein n=1 Tax=Brevibacillus centrosporus TaxID=54910 RepID=UPI003D1E67D1